MFDDRFRQRGDDKNTVSGRRIYGSLPNGILRKITRVHTISQGRSTHNIIIIIITI